MDLIERNKSIEEVKQMPALVWAYVGDCVYELSIRNHLVQTTRLHPHELHIESISYVKAKAQAEMLSKIDELLTEEEKYIVKQGRNAQNHHLPKNSDIHEYMYATAFEALIGYLYLSKQDDRLKEILENCLKMK